MDDGPLSVFAYPDGDWFHDAFAIGSAVAGDDVEVEAMEAGGAVVSMFGTGSVGIDDGAAMAAPERLIEDA